MGLLDTLKAYMSEVIENDDVEAAAPEVAEPQKPSPAPVHSNPAERRLPESAPSVQSIKMFQPGHFDDCQFIADALKQGHAAIVNYYYTLESTAKRIRYFMSGCIYALDGFDETVSEYIVLYTPRHTGILSSKKKTEVHDSPLQFPWEKE